MEPIYVTKTFLPPEEEYLQWLRKAYSTHVLTNNGPIVRELEETLRARFDVPYLRSMANGTLAIQLALRALNVKGKVITTPFSYVATTSAILWEGLEPVFVDIDPATFCIDPNLIEAAITPDTTAILATHVYGIPCDVEAIDAIAKKHGLKVIYDAAHAFDVTYKGRSILQWGDASTLSFHATKLFHTVEGGAVVLHDADADERLRLLRSFGHIGDEHFSLGMNAKMSEVHAAMGMAVLPYVEQCIRDRGMIRARYDEVLRDTGIGVLPTLRRVEHNYAYYPVLCETGEHRQAIQEELGRRNIFTRRYFYPSLNKLPYTNGASTPVSEHTAEVALSLPFYPGMPDRVIEIVGTVVRQVVDPAKALN
ncbi:MAG: DegT/DnrJ/EryC1/StrS family aminotransferase [Flavobacteriales bacterium]|nr:DegT/DnrJ/EryC1/StrS family aminotransferase [Flavobacteriales bacterium]